MTANSTAETALALIGKLQEAGVDGKVPGMKSSLELAHDYLDSGSYKTHEDCIKSLIRWETSKTGGTGFVTGLGGLVTLPATLAAGLGAAWIVQVRLVGSIAYLRGWDLDDDRVRTLCVAALAGDKVVTEVVKEFGGKLAIKSGEAALAKVSGKVLLDINRRVGYRLITKGGEKGLINMGKLVPVLGGVVGGAVDATATRAVAGVAKRAFPDRPADGQGCYATLAALGEPQAALAA